MKNLGKCVLAATMVVGLYGVSFASAEMALGYPGGSTVNSAAASNQNQSQGQGQAQYQGHAVSQSGNSSVGNSGNTSFTDSFNGADPIRYLPIPTNVMVGTQGGPQIFGSPDYADRGPNFMSMKALVTAMNSIDLDEAIIEDDGDVEMVAQLINSLDADERAATADTDIEFFLNTKAKVTDTIPGLKVISVVTLKSDDEDTINSATLAVKLAQQARAVGGNKIVLVSEGTTKRLSSWGVGIGLSYNMASVGSDASDVGMVGAGGTGWSTGESEYFSLPYVTAVIGY